MAGTQSAAETLATAMQEQSWSTSNWREHELHPRVEDLGSEEAVLNFIFTMDLLNFSFWDDGVDGSSSFAQLGVEGLVRGFLADAAPTFEVAVPSPAHRRPLPLPAPAAEDQRV